MAVALVGQQGQVDNRRRLGIRAGNRDLSGGKGLVDRNGKRTDAAAKSMPEAGTLIVTPTAGEVPVAAEELNAEISDMYPLVEVPRPLWMPPPVF